MKGMTGNWLRRIVALMLLAAPMVLTASDSADTEADIALLKEKYANVDEVRATPVPGLYELRFGYRIAYVGRQRAVRVPGFRRSAGRFQRREPHRGEARGSAARTDGEPGSVGHAGFSARSARSMCCWSSPMSIAAIAAGCISRWRNITNWALACATPPFRVRAPIRMPGNTMQSIWCSDNPSEAMTVAKAGGFVPQLQCDSLSVERHYELGRQVGLSGTPALLTPAGDLIPGYVPPLRLAAILAEEESASN